MKYFSEITEKLYDSQEELVAAEKKIADEKAAAEKKELERKKDSEKIEKSIDNTQKLIDEFEKKYGVPFDFEYSDEEEEDYINPEKAINSNAAAAEAMKNFLKLILN